MNTPLTYTIIIDGEPVAQPRPRFDPRSGRAYTPADHPINDYKGAILAAWIDVNAPKIEKPHAVGIKVTALMPQTKAQAKKKEQSEQWHTVRPDADNIMKGVLDALNGHAWDDDSQVCNTFIAKRICAGGDTPRTEITITLLE